MKTDKELLSDALEIIKEKNHAIMELKRNKGIPELRRRIAELERDAVNDEMAFNDHIKRLYRMSETLRMFADCEYPLTDFPRIARECLAEIGAMQ